MAVVVFVPPPLTGIVAAVPVVTVAGRVSVIVVGAGFIHIPRPEGAPVGSVSYPAVGVPKFFK